MFADLISREGAGLFHDFELACVTVDHQNKQATVQLKSPRDPQSVHELRLFGVQHFQMELTEPWGKGSYVAGTDFEQKDSACSIELLLNSGDVVAAVFERAEFDGE